MRTQSGPAPGPARSRRVDRQRHRGRPHRGEAATSAAGAISQAAGGSASASASDLDHRGRARRVAPPADPVRHAPARAGRPAAADAEEQPDRRARSRRRGPPPRREVREVDHGRHHPRRVQPPGGISSRSAGAAGPLGHRAGAAAQRHVRPARMREGPRATSRQRRPARSPARPSPAAPAPAARRGDAEADAPHHHPARRAPPRRRHAGLRRRPGQRHQEAARDAGQRAPAHQPPEAAMPGAGEQRHDDQRHAGVEGARHADARARPAAGQRADQVAEQRGRAEQPGLAAIHPACRDHGGKQRHIGEAREAVARAGRRRAGERGAEEAGAQRRGVFQEVEQQRGGLPPAVPAAPNGRRRRSGGTPRMSRAGGAAASRSIAPGVWWMPQSLRAGDEDGGHVDASGR